MALRYTKKVWQLFFTCLYQRLMLNNKNIACITAFIFDANQLNFGLCCRGR
jgi:hypothetical protein